MRRIYKSFSIRVFTGFFAVILCCIVMISTAVGRMNLESLKTNNYATANGLLNQVQYFYDSKFGELETYLDAITSGTEYLHLMKKNYYKTHSTAYYMDINAIINNMQAMKKNYNDIIDSIYYYNEEHNLELYTIAKGPVVAIDNTKLLNMVEETGSLKTGWIMAYDETVFDTISPRKVISLYRYTAGTLFCINLSVTIFQEGLNNSVFGENCYLTLLGQGKMMVSIPYQDRYLLDDVSFWKEPIQKDWVSVVNNKKETLWVTNVILESNGWTVAAVMPKDYLQSEAVKLYEAVIRWAVLILVFASGIAYLISRSVTGPVRFITRQMQKVQENNLDVDFSLKDKESELGIMAETLNQMEGRMIALIEQTKEHERLRRKLEISVLQAQMNPHFLYNTLASAQGLIHERENNKAEYLLKMLTVFFRKGLGRGSDKVTIADELEHIKSYLEIQKMRYGNCFSYEVEVEDGLETAEIIKLSLQPMIENAIYHGVKELLGQRMVLISVKRNHDTMELCVFDDGAGMSKERLQMVKEEMEKPFEEGSSLVTYGLRNVNQRLILEYGKDYGIEIESVLGEYTMVTMKIPFKKCEGNRENTNSR